MGEKKIQEPKQTKGLLTKKKEPVHENIELHQNKKPMETVSYKSILLNIFKNKTYDLSENKTSEKKVVESQHSSKITDAVIPYDEPYSKQLKPTRIRIPSNRRNYIGLFTETLNQKPSNISEAYTRFKRQSLFKSSRHRSKRSIKGQKFPSEDSTSAPPTLVALMALDAIVALFAFNAVVALLILAT